MSISVNEQETTISFGRADAGATIWTSDRTIMTKLDKYVAKSEFYSSKEQKDADGNLLAKEYFITDKNLISFRSGKVTLTAEQKAERVKRLSH